MKTLIFPDDFEKKAHSVSPGATQWLLKTPEDYKGEAITNIAAGQTIISVVGGAMGLYGDGVNTFEMWDFREDEPQAYLSKEDINAHLLANPIG